MAREGCPLCFVRCADVSEAAAGSCCVHRVENDEDRVRGIWRRIYGDLVLLEDYSLSEMNQNSPKADNVEAILAD